jgi:hypothetical protein
MEASPINSLGFPVFVKFPLITTSESLYLCGLGFVLVGIDGNMPFGALNVVLQLLDIDWPSALFLVDLNTHL